MIFKKIRKPLCLMLCTAVACSVLGGLAVPSKAAEEKSGCAIIPLPVEYQEREGKFTLQDSSRFVVTTNEGAEDVQSSVEVVAAEFRKSTGYQLPVLQGTAKDGDIAIRLDASMKEEAYTLSVGAKRVEIAAKDAGGVYYALQSLRQMLPGQIESEEAVTGVEWSAPCAEIRDEPRFSYRSIQLDVARHFFSAEEVKRQIDHMSQYKINKLHMHLADDQGWRLEIKNSGVKDKDGNVIDFTPLTTIGASTSCTHNGERPGFYTQEQFKDIVAYAALRNVEIVPEFDMPAHAWAALVSMPMLNSTPDGKPHADKKYDNTKPYQGWDVGWASMECNNENTYIFVEEVIKQVSALCPGKYFHIGGDEAKVTPHNDYVKFVRRVTDIAQKYDKTPIGWQNYDQVIDDKENTITQYWDSTGRRATPDIKYIASPANLIYMDMQYDANCPLGLNWAGYIPVNKAYNWDPTDFGTEEQFVGIEAPIWTETMSEPEHLDYMYYPRVPGVAEVAWSQKDARSWDNYKNRLQQHGDRLDNLDINYRKDTMIWELPINFRMPMDEGTGNTIKDVTGNFQGTLVNGVAWGEGKYGKGLVFNGNSYVDLKYDDINGDWTVGMWVKRENSGASNAALIAGTAGEIKLEQWENTGKVGLTAYGQRDDTFNYTAPIGEWVHLAFVSANGGTTLYVNGAEQDRINATIGGPVSRIGANYKDGLSDRGYMKGSIDDLQVYNRALSAEEVAKMQADAFGFDQELIFNFNEGRDGTATDVSGNHTLTIGEGVVWTEGSHGTGLKFGGTGYVDLNCRDLGKNWTASMWVNRGESVQSNAVLLSGNEGEIKLDQWENTGKVGITAFNVQDAAFDYSAPIGQWVHLTFVSNEQGTTLYVNGAEKGHIDLAINCPLKRIGANAKAGMADGGYLNGAIDELKIFNKTMNAEEVKALVEAANTDTIEALTAKLEEALKNADRYEPSTLEGVQQLVDQAKALAAHEVVTPNEAKAMEGALTKALEGLEVIEPVDKSELQDLVTRAEGADLTGYTAESVEAFQDALEAAKAILADETLTQKDQATVDAAAEKLAAAIDGLTAKPTPNPNPNPNPENPDPENPDPENPDPENPAPENPDPDPENPNPEDPENPTPDPDVKPEPPKTGDNSRMMLWLTVAMASVAGVACAAVALLNSNKRRSI